MKKLVLVFCAVMVVLASSCSNVYNTQNQEGDSGCIIAYPPETNGR